MSLKPLVSGLTFPEIQMAEIPTVKIKDDNAPGGHVIINESDFDEKKHKLYVEPKRKKEKE